MGFTRVQIRSERDLPNCATANTVCSILQKRYWIPSILNRYCRCPEGIDCPSDWTGVDYVAVNNVSSLVRVIKGPEYSLALTNRAQMKVSFLFTFNLKENPLTISRKLTVLLIHEIDRNMRT